MDVRVERTLPLSVVRASPAGSASRRRWAIWSEQQHLGHEPCFGTEARIFCREASCPWRVECLGLKAEWRR